MQKVEVRMKEFNQDRISSLHATLSDALDKIAAALEKHQEAAAAAASSNK